MEKLKIAHIINPVKVEPDHPSYLYLAQPVTFESMLNAKRVAENDVDVEFYTAQYPEDREIIPEGFNITSDLEKTVHDYFEFKDKSKKLPTIRDILMKLYENSDADYFIYTNADIGLKPNFYSYIKDKIQDGAEGICIHRCDLPKKHSKLGILNINNIEEIYKLRGQMTFGHDCFVFPRVIVPKMKLKNIFVAYPPIGTVIRNQIKLNVKKFVEIKSNEDLTFHIGFDKAWAKNSKKNEYFQANRKEAGHLRYSR